MDKLEFRSPSVAECDDMIELVKQTDKLDANSNYLYVLCCLHFAQTCAIAKQGKDTVAFLIGYRLPDDPSIFFVWQTAAKPRHGIPQLGLKLMLHSAREAIAAGATEIQATVDQNNKPIVMLFKTVARKLSADITFSHFCDGDLLGIGDHADHHDETLISIKVAQS